MRVEFEFKKYHSWFGFCKMPERVRDLGDIVIYIFKIQITIWTKKPNKFPKPAYRELK